jgi:chemotaxis protein methyltransferase CheR
MTNSEFQFISDFIKSKYGVDLHKKRTLIEGRLGTYISGLGFKNYQAYFDFAQNDPSGDELVTLLNKLTTNYTYFMREKDHFDFYTKKILPWIDTELKSKDLRLWCAGCSTGQEVYTLALLTLEYLGVRASSWDHTILASDISNKALDTARLGSYPAEDLAELPSNWQKQYFTTLDTRLYSVIDTLKKSVVFKRLNLLDPFHFKSSFQTIFCRNVMIYFDSQTKTELINKYYDVLVRGGYLIIGHSESISSLKHNYQYIQPSIYRKPL